MLQHCVVFLLKAFDHAFHEPFSHVLAGMLLGNHPDLALAFGTVTFAQQLNITTLDTFADSQQVCAGLFLCLFDQPVMALTAVGFEIRKPDLRLVRRKAEVQCLAVKTGRHPKPALLVVGRYGVVAGPGIVEGGLAGIGQAETIGLADVQAVSLEMKPLEMRALRVWPDRQAYMRGVACVENLNIATVEI